MATTRKTTTRSSAAKKAAPSPADALMAAAGTAPADPADAGKGEGSEALDKKQLIDRVVIASGVRKRDVKAAVEAALEAMGAALDEGRQVKIQPLGALRVVKANEGGRSATLTLKLRRRRAGGDDAEGAASEVADGGDAE